MKDALQEHGWHKHQQINKASTNVFEGQLNIVVPCAFAKSSYIIA